MNRARDIANFEDWKNKQSLRHQSHISFRRMAWGLVVLGYFVLASVGFLLMVSWGVGVVAGWGK